MWYGSIGNEERCAIGWDGGATPTNGSHTLTGRLPSCAPEKNFQIVHQKI